MINRDNPLQQYLVVNMVIEAIADWVNKYREARLGNDLDRCSPDEIRTIAKDLGLTPSELSALAAQGPDAAEPLKKMLIALKVDANAFDQIDPRIKSDLQRSCILCGEKRRCRHELAAGTAAKNIHEFCPNAVTIETLFGQGRFAATGLH
jgi:hypothetical protein